MSINLQNPPKTLKELYEFFAPNLIKPPRKHGYICSGIQLDRPGWHTEIYGRPIDDTMFMWFYSHPNRDPKWVMRYDKCENSSQDS